MPLMLNVVTLLIPLLIDAIVESFRLITKEGLNGIIMVIGEKKIEKFASVSAFNVIDVQKEFFDDAVKRTPLNSGIKIDEIRESINGNIGEMEAMRMSAFFSFFHDEEVLSEVNFEKRVVSLSEIGMLACDSKVSVSSTVSSGISMTVSTSANSVCSESSSKSSE